MLTLIAYNLVPIAMALAIGVATGWWMFADSGPADRGDEDMRP